MFLFINRQDSPSWYIQSLIAQHVKYVNYNALSMFKALNECFILEEIMRNDVKRILVRMALCY